MNLKLILCNVVLRALTYVSSTVRHLVTCIVVLLTFLENRCGEWSMSLNKLPGQYLMLVLLGVQL